MRRPAAAAAAPLLPLLLRRAAGCSEAAAAAHASSGLPQLQQQLQQQLHQQQLRGLATSAAARSWWWAAAAAAAAGQPAAAAVGLAARQQHQLLPLMPSQQQHHHCFQQQQQQQQRQQQQRRGFRTSASPLSAAGLQDYYDVLGIARGASDQDIKKSYYKLAKKYHPDTNKDNPEAARRFQEVSKAYETLRDPEKRRLYDALGREGMERMEAEGGGGPGGPGGFGGFRASGGFGGGGGGGGSPFSAQDIFEHFFRQDPSGFGSFFGGNMFVESSMRLSFMEAAKGAKKRVDLSRVVGMALPPVEVDIPAGVDTGQQIQVAAPIAAPPGQEKQQQPQRVTVLFRLEVEPHQHFRRQGLDVLCTAPLRLAEALMGRTLNVPTIEGHAEVVVPPLTLNGDVLRMRGKGISDPRGRGRGDQLVTVRVIKPSKLTERQRELLREFDAEETRGSSGGGGSGGGSSSGSSGSSSGKRGWFS